jgi:hypothetical protein
VNGGQLPRHIINVDGVLFGKFEQMRFGVLGDVEQDFRPLKAKLALQLLHPGPLPGAELPAIAPGCAVAETVLLKQDDGHARLCQMRSSGEPGEPAADDEDIGSQRAGKRGIRRALADRVLIP